MTNTNLLCAMGEIDPALIAAASPDAIQKKTVSRPLWKWASLAACLCLVVIGALILPRLSGYHSGYSEDELFARSNTYFESYEELAAIIGNDTLLENIDFSSLAAYELRLVHELDNAQAYHTVSFVNDMPNDDFGFGLHFPPYSKKTPNFISNGETRIVNGIGILYEYRRTDGTDLCYDIAAEFEHNGYCYQIRAMGSGDESVFWENLAVLLGE